MIKIPESFNAHTRGACRGERYPAPFAHVPVIPGLPFGSLPSWVQAGIARANLESTPAAGFLRTAGGAAAG